MVNWLIRLIRKIKNRKGEYEEINEAYEKIYKTMSSTGACSLTVGIIVLATGIVTGIMMIVNGARLLKKKSEILI